MPGAPTAEWTRIAVCTDVHANLPALRTALTAIDRLGVDALYHTGDLIGIGPYPAECLEVLLERPDARCVIGNHDAWFAFGLPHPRPDWMSEAEWEHQQWVHAQLDAALRPVVAAWPYVLAARVGGVEVELMHYALAEDGRRFRAIRPLASGADADALFGRRDARLVFYGHHHRTSDVTGVATRYVNPGSLGCDAEPLARFAILESRPGGAYHLTRHAVRYDPSGVAAELERRRVPARDVIRQHFMPWATPQPRRADDPGRVGPGVGDAGLAGPA
jgi:predicted phosphodiesterase